MSTSDLSEVKDATVEDDTSENRYSTTPGHGIVKISPQNGSEEREGTYEDLNPTPDKGSFKKGGHDNEASSERFMVERWSLASALLLFCYLQQVCFLVS